jgi:hypothetical protein
MSAPARILPRLLAATLLAPALLWAATLRLQLVDGDEGIPVAGATVEAGMAGIHAVSDEQGLVSLDGLLPGRQWIHIRHLAYRPRHLELQLEADAAPPLLLRLEPVSLPLPDLVVLGGDGQSRVQLILDPALPAPLRQPAAVLERLPGLSLQESQEGGRLEARLRGARADQLLVRVDGVPLNPASGAAVDLGTIDWSRVGRVVLLPDGARPGGELRITTRAPDSLLHARLALGLGSHGRREFSAATGGSLAGSRWRLHAAGLATDGDVPYRDEQGRELRRLNQEQDRRSGGLELALPDRGTRLQLEVRRAVQGLPGPLYQPPTPAAGQEERQLVARFSKAWQDHGQLDLWARQHAVDLDSPARQWHPGEGLWLQRVPFALRSRERQAGARFQVPLKRGSVEVRLVHHDYRQSDELRADPLAGEARREQLTLQGEHSGFLGPSLKLHLRAGLEGLLDAHADRRRPELLGHASASLEHLWRRGRIHGAGFAGLSHSRQAPAFRPLFLAESAFTLGNPRLSPEQQTGLSTGLRAAMPGSAFEPMLRVELWARRYRDGIIWRRNYRSQYLPVNLSRSTALGLDASAACRWRNWSLDGALTLQRLRNEEPGSPYRGRRLPFQPDLLGRFALGWEQGGTGLQASLSLQGRSYGSESNLDPHGIAGVGLPAWQRLDLLAWQGWRWSKQSLRLSAALRNLLDDEIETVDGFPLAGRSWNLQLEILR